MDRRISTAALVVLLLLSTAAGSQAGKVQDAAGSHRTSIDVSTRVADYRDDRIIVRFRADDPADRAGTPVTAASVHARAGTRVLSDLSPIGMPRTHVVGLPPGRSVADAIALYERQPEVLYAEPDYVVHVLLAPDDPYLRYSWGLHNTGQTGGTPDADIDAPEAWEVATGSPSVVVAIVDTGIDASHPDLSGNLWTNPGEIAGNEIDDDGNGYVDDLHGWDFHDEDGNPFDDNGHGSHTAGTIAAAGNNGIGTTGVAWRARIMPLKFLDETGTGYISDAVEAILYANAKGAHVISNSWGGGGYSQTLRDAIAASPAVVVCAAGNAGTSNDVTPYYPAGYRTPQQIAVAATDSTDRLASYPGWWASNYGASTVDCAAPGADIYSTLPGGYGWMSGTSMATPHVSGIAALLKASYPEMTSVQIKSAILGNVDAIPALAGKVATGGRVNAARALAAPAIAADFTANTTSGLSPMTVQFTDRSTGTISSYLWSFGDGSTSTERNPVHTYTSPTMRNYTVTLTVRNAYRENTLTRTEYLSMVTSHAPVAVLSANTTSGTVPLAVRFGDHSLGAVSIWVWSFGDGAEFTTTNPALRHPEHTYANPGTYAARLTVCSGGTCNTTNPGTPVTVLPKAGSLVAAFSSNVTVGTSPLVVQFTDTSLGDPASWYWTFGDGTTSIEKNPVHTYTSTNDGNYTVSLTVRRGDQSSQASKSRYIRIYLPTTPPKADFTSNTTSGHTPLTVQFIDTSTGNPTSWYWTFNDGTYSRAKNPIHTFKTAKNYTVTLKAINARGATTLSRQAYIAVAPPPDA